MSAIYSACGEGTRKAPSEGSGAEARATSRDRLCQGSSALNTFSSATTCEIQIPDPVDMLEDPRELPHHRLHFLLGETQTGKLGDMQDLIALNHRRDSMNCITFSTCWIEK
jgi:hypothetical protein